MLSMDDKRDVGVMHGVEEALHAGVGDRALGP